MLTKILAGVVAAVAVTAVALSVGIPGLTGESSSCQGTCPISAALSGDTGSSCCADKADTCCSETQVSIEQDADCASCSKCSESKVNAISACTGGLTVGAKTTKAEGKCCSE